MELNVDGSDDSWSLYKWCILYSSGEYLSLHKSIARAHTTPMTPEQQFQQCLRQSKRVVALVGAGLLAASGLPIFQGSQPLWNNYSMIDLATPDAFYFDPALVWQYYAHRRRQAQAAEPNAGHLALARFSNNENVDCITITQNDDGLHQRAGHAQGLHEVQGSLFEVKCTSFTCTYSGRSDRLTDRLEEICSRPKDQSDVEDGGAVQDIELRELPHCPVCGTLMRPGVVWFGEPLPLRVLDEIDTFLQQGVDLILVVGTSGTVYPANSYAELVRLRGGSVAVFNTEIDDDVMAGNVENTWGFRGNAAETLPKLLDQDEKHAVTSVRDGGGMS